MKRRSCLFFSLLTMFVVTTFAAHPADARELGGSQPGDAHSFAVRDGHFELDGKAIQIISGEMHYPRIPRAYWRVRFRMARPWG